MNPNDIVPEHAYCLSGAQLIRLRNVAKRLYTERRMDGDEMRDLAQIIFDGVLPQAIDTGEDA